MTHRTKIRPLFADADPMNVVYYGKYLTFFERGRAELMRSTGRPYAELAAQGLHLPVTEAHLRYIRPARYDDPLVVETRLAWVKKASLRFDYRILLQDDGGTEKELVNGYTVHGCVNLEGRVSPLPAWVTNNLKILIKSDKPSETDCPGTVKITHALALP